MNVLHTSILLTVFSVLELHADEIVPTDAKVLISKRDNAIAKIEEAYERELAKLKVKYTKKGDLDSAVAIVALLDTTKSPRIKMREGSKDELVGTKWSFLGINKQEINTFTFNSDWTVKCATSYKNAKWRRLDSKTILFHYGIEGSYCVLSYNGKDKDLMSGSNVAGRKRYLRLIKK